MTYSQPPSAQSSSCDLTVPPDLVTLARNSADARKLRQRSLLNLLKMGHCAPTIMQTALDLVGGQSRWLIRLSAGLPGGIGNMGNECGGVTVPMLLLGLQSASATDTTAPGSLPTAFIKAHAFLRKSSSGQRSLLCREIRGGARLPLVCIGVIQRATQLLAAVANEPGASVLDPERAAGYGAAYTGFERAQFHCAHAVFREVAAPALPEPRLCEAASLFVGGIALAGMTCSALTAGILLLGNELATIETSRARVLRMLGLMAFGGDAFADEVNEFNKSMNRGQRLARWFESTFGSTQCRELTHCDFGVRAEVGEYIGSGGLERCRMLARRVGVQVREMVAEGKGQRALTPRGA